MPRGKAHDAEVKAAVVAALLGGQGVSQVAREYHLSRATVSYWKKQNEGLSKQVGPEKRVEIGELIGSVVTEYLTTLRELAIQARSPDWMQKQSAADLGVFMGVQMDKVIRILEAMEPEVEEPASP